MNDERDKNIANGVWWTVLVIAFCILVFGCTRKVYIPVEHKTIETMTLHDTIVEVRLDIIHDSIITPDTINYLENKYAGSWAKWVDGKLHHSLTSKDVELPIKVQYIDREKRIEIPKPYPVEVKVEVEKKLSNWQKIKMEVGGFAAGGFLLVCVILIRLTFKKLKK